MGGKVGVLVEIDGCTCDVAKELAHDVALQIAASKPLYIKPEEVPAEVIEHEKKILKEQIVNDGKPENIAEKIVAGRIGKYYKEVCLLNQPFVKDSSMSIDEYVKSFAKDMGVEIKIASFVRFEKGEGIEKKEDNFAEEVAGMIK